MKPFFKLSVGLTAFITGTSLLFVNTQSVSPIAGLLIIETCYLIASAFIASLYAYRNQPNISKSNFSRPFISVIATLAFFIGINVIFAFFAWIGGLNA